MPWRPVARPGPRQRQPDTRPSSAQRGYSYQWQQTRARFLRHNPTCALCGAEATEPHHIIPRRAGGTDDDDNLLPLCRPCHSRITSRETPRTYRPTMTDTRQRFALRDRSPNRAASVVVHLVGQPASGKSWLAAQLDEALGLPWYSIDHERQRARVQPGDDLLAWVALENHLDATSPALCETAGVNPNDTPLLVGRTVYRIGCTASDTVRATRLAQRPDVDADTLGRLTASATTALPVDVWFDSTAPDQGALAALIDGAEAWLRRVMQR